MTQDRDLFAETWFNVPSYEAGPARRRPGARRCRPTSSRAGSGPAMRDFGANAKYYKQNLEEAKKLIEPPDAAARRIQVDLLGIRMVPNTIGRSTTEGMAADAGFKPQPNGVIYQSDLIPNYQSPGRIRGMGWMLRPQSSSDPIDKFAEYNFSVRSELHWYDTSGRRSLRRSPWTT